MSILKLDGNKVLLWGTNILVGVSISCLSYFFVQFRELEKRVSSHDAIIVDIPSLRTREASMEREIAEIRADANTKLGMDAHLRFRDQMEARHIENLKSIADLQTRMANLPKEFPPPWFLQQFGELREAVKVNGILLHDQNIRFAHLEEKLNSLLAK